MMEDHMENDVVVPRISIVTVIAPAARLAMHFD